MYWLTFLILALLLYLPPFSLAEHLWRWAQAQEWWVLVLGWRAPAWLAFTSWLILVYLVPATALHIAHRRLPAAHAATQAMLRLLRVRLGELDVAVAAAALITLALAWPILPIMQNRYGWGLSISTPVAGLALLTLLAEALRLAEGHYWADRAYEAARIRWLADQGHQ